jgi:hypothetical protein
MNDSVKWCPWRHPNRARTRRLTRTIAPVRSGPRFWLAGRGWGVALVVVLLLSIASGCLAPAAGASPATPTDHSNAGASSPGQNDASTGNASPARSTATEGPHGGTSVWVPAAAAPSDGAVPCASLLQDPGQVKDTGLVNCLENSIQHLHGFDYRLYYPAEWKTSGGWGLKYLKLTTEAIERSADVYNNLGSMISVNLVFANLLPAGYDAAADATSNSVIRGGAGCSVRLFPSMAKGGDEGSILGTIAHELFHCFQFVHFDAQTNAPGRNWWFEGSAEYFANVVYPTLNFEWGLARQFDPSTPLTQQTYANCLFFQFLGNTIGNEAILKLFAAMPASGGEKEQQAALLAFPGFLDLYQDFAQHYLDKAIVDTGGGVVPAIPLVGPPFYDVPGSMTVKNIPVPFTFQVIPFVFADEPLFTTAIDISGGQSRYSARPAIAGSVWQDRLPAEIGCDDARTYLVLFSSFADSPTGEVKVTHTFTGSEPTCEKSVADTCLAGVWAVTDFEAYLVSAYAATNAEAEVQYEGQTGSLIYNFDGKNVTVLADEFAIELTATIAGMDAGIEIVLNGTTSTSYHVTRGGVGKADSVPSGITVELQVLLDGDVMYDDEVPSLLQLIGGSFTYACDGDTLQLAVLGPSGEPLPPMTQTRQA